MILYPKQKLAFDLLTDNTTKTLGYGGAAGGGKTILGSYWMQVMCSALRESKWFIGRDSLKDTRESVLFTMKKVSKMTDLVKWNYNDNHIYFENGSQIEFLDLSFYPIKDPLYESFGSKEYTGGWIEEAGNVNEMAFEVLKLRVNRWYNKEFGLDIGKMLVTFNPKKNWVDSTFYRPYVKEEELPDTKFIRALATDNPGLPPEYLESLRNIKDPSTRARLLDGNFDYDDDPNALISYESIYNMFRNDHIRQNPADKCIICDVARFGSDKAVITVWYGLVLTEYYVFDLSSTITIQNCINAMRRKHGIPATRCLADEDGVGGGVVDVCGILGFHNGGRPADKAYQTIKDQCGYLLAEKISGIFIECPMANEHKERIMLEFAQLKTWQADKDNKLRIMPKEKIKENIKGSPDWLDVFLMRMYFYAYPAAMYDSAYRSAVKLLG